MSTLREALDRLQPIVDTIIAPTLIRDPGGVAQRYAEAGAHYHPSERIAAWSGRIVSDIAAGSPVTGYVVGDFGYGKTSASLFLARQCEAADMVAVPPVVYTSIDEMAAGMHAWVRHVIDAHRPSLVGTLDEEYARVTGRLDAPAFVQFARACTNRVVEAGFKGLVFIVDEVQEYINFDEATAARIQGLSHMVKGVRDFAGIVANGRATALGTPFGLVLLMPASPTEGALRQQADDMMQRMEERGTSLRLDDAYGEQFVRDVWGRVCTALDDPDAGQRIVHDRTFVALGQLVSRRDLSNGPRTMVQAFGRVVTHADAGTGTYTALDLAADYRDGHLVFDGPSHRVTSTMASLLRRPEVEADDRFRRAVLLLAVFPDGLSEEAADAIDAVAPLPGGLPNRASTYQAILDLNEAPHLWLGTTTYQIRAGAYALVALQTDARAPDVMSTLIREFSVWYRNLDASKRAAFALGAFIESVVPVLLEVRKPGTDVGFSYRDGSNNWTSDAQAVVYRVLQGAPGMSFQKFPDRRLCLAVGTDPAAVRAFAPPAGVTCHLVWRIVLVPPTATEDGAAALVTIESARADRCVDLRLPLGRSLGAELPPDLDVLRNRVSPERTNAQVMLALIFYAGESLRRNAAMSEADKQQHEQLVRDLVREVVRLLLPNVNDPARVRVVGIAIGAGGAIALAGAERALMEALFRIKCAELFPDYRPLAGYGQWESNVSKYLVGLRQSTLAERRGQQPVTRDEKQQVAGLFGLTNTGLDSFRTYCKERGLLGPETRDTPASVRGREPASTLVFTESPLETLVRSVLDGRGRQVPVTTAGHTRNLRTLELSLIRNEVAKSGYLSEEVDAAVELLRTRQYVRTLPDGTVQQHPGDITAIDLRAKQADLDARVSRLAHVLARASVDILQAQAYATRQRLAGEPDEIALDTAERELEAARKALGEALGRACDGSQQRLRDARVKVRTLREGLRVAEAEKAVVGSVNFVGAVDETRRRLVGKVRDCDRRLGDVDTETGRLMGTNSQTDDASLALAAGVVQVASSLEDLGPEATNLGKLVETLAHWRIIVNDAGSLLPEPQTEEWIRFDREVCAEVLQHLSGREPESLAGYDHFKTLVEERKRERDREQLAVRNAFESTRLAYEQRLRGLVDQFSLRTSLTPADVDGSYRLLRGEVIEKIRPWIADVDGEAGRLLDDLAFLRTERGMDVGAWVDKLLASRRDLDGIGSLLPEACQTPEDLEVVSDRLRVVRNETIGPARSELERLRITTEPADSLEQLMLTTLDAVPRPRPADPVSIEALRRSGGSDIDLEHLLDVVGRLYRKGHLDIQIRLRKP